MIITRTPLRVSLGGGGTDLPSFYRDSGGGFLVAAAITKYIYIAVHRNFDGDILLKYSSLEKVKSAHEVKHPLFREVLLTTGIARSVEISSMADIPAGTGLGSSGAFTVGLLKALYAHSHRLATNEDLAALACHIEIDRLGEPVGKQDQYAAAIGGITAFEYLPDDTVRITPVDMSIDARSRFEDGLVLFYTGIRRSASEELTTQVGSTPAPGVLDVNLRSVRDIGRQSFDALRAGALEDFACLMTAQWELKYSRAPSATHDQVDFWIRQGVAAGALGGKLVGAGGGGFLLFFADAKAALRHRMAALGLEEVRFGFDYEGAKTLVS